MADLPSLESLQRKIDEAKTHSGGDEQGDAAPEAPSGYGRAMQLGSELLAGVGVGSVLGYFLDRAFDTSPFLFIGGVFLGFAAGVRNIMRGIEKEK